MSKAALQEVPALTLLVVQLAASTASLWGAVGARRVHVPARARTWQLGLIGLLEPGLANTFGLLGLALTTASMSSLIWASEPILIIGLAWLILRERPSRRFVVLSALAGIGVLLVAGITPGTAGTAALLGNGLVLVGVSCCALYSVLTRRIVGQLDSVLLVAVQQTVALAWAVLIWPIALLHGEAAFLSSIRPSMWALAASSGIVYYALAFWFYIVGLKMAPASVAGLFLSLVPIFGIGGAYVFLGEQLSTVQSIGALLVLVSVTGVLRRRVATTEVLYRQI